MKKLLYLLPIVLIAGIFTAEARPIYARREGKACGYCHLSVRGGGERGFRGMFYGGNNLSFQRFDEKRESSIAGVAMDVVASEAAAKCRYVGNVSGPATAQVQLASLHGPVLVVFFDKADTSQKLAAKVLKEVALAYGNAVTVVSVAPVDMDAALKLTQDLDSKLRVLPDPDRAAIKKFGVRKGLDMVAISRLGETFKVFDGFSQANVKRAMAELAGFGAAHPTVDVSDAPVKVARGGPLSS